MVRRSQVGGRRSEGSRANSKKLPTSDHPSPTAEVELSKDFRFEAAHYLPNVPEGHKCRRMHGHSFHGEIVVRGPIDPARGWLLDYADLKRALDPIVARLDHYLLNEIAGLENPTSEMIAIWFYRQLKPALPILHSVAIEETCTTRCVFRG